jgi:hypothetical protein
MGWRSHQLDQPKQRPLDPEGRADERRMICHRNVVISTIENSEDELVSALALLLSGDARYDARLIATYCDDFGLDPERVIRTFHYRCTWPISESTH